jgi:hypothetical protein
MFVSGDTIHGGQPMPRAEFKLGQVPEVVITGYAGKVITLELWQEGALSARSNFTVPGDRMTRQETGVVMEENFGMMRPVRRTQYQILRAGLIVPLKRPMVGTYEVRLVLDDVIRQSAQFRVVKP